MNLLRRVICIPTAAIVALLIGIAWSSVFSSAYFSYNSIVRSLIGLGPSVLGRALPVFVFVTLATFIAPRPTKVTCILFGFMGGMFGWPFGPKYELDTSGAIFYLAEGIGALIGAGVGLSIALVICRRRLNMRKLENENGA